MGTAKCPKAPIQLCLLDIIEGTNWEVRAVAFPIKTCAICGEEFELKPDKPGFANRCPDCSEEDESGVTGADGKTSDRELNEARKNAMRDLLYRKDS
jgi:hypothetical protein